MPQVWKIRRELTRLIQQIVGLPSDAFSYFLGSRYYDLFLSGRRRTLSGAQGTSERKAVYLIFPVNGLLPTHIRTLEYLTSKGLSVTVVSNVPLGQEDEAKLLKLCYRYIERPNFGYDFGGYRDGVLSLRQDLLNTKQLVLINDSVWFPISSETDWLDDVDTLGVDFAGAGSNYGILRVEPTTFRDLIFNYRTDHKNFHYCSFALSCGENILRHPEFLQFWQHFPLSSKKKRTVRHGEIGLTSWVLKHGFTHGETLGVANLRQYLDALDESRLLEVASQVIIPEDDRMKRVKDNLRPQMERLSRDDLTNFILTATARQGASYALAYFSILERGYPFLKKSPLWLDLETSDISLRILEKVDTPAAREALEEARLLQLRT